MVVMSLLGLSENAEASRSRSRQRETKERASRPAAAKREARDADMDSDMAELVGMIGRVSLSAMSRADNALGMMLDVMLLPEDAQGPAGKLLTVVMKDKMREYHELTQAASKENKAKVGPPHVRAWEGLLAWAEQYQEGNEALKVALQEHVAELKTVKPTERVNTIASSVKYCRVNKAYKKGVIKLEVRVEDVEELRSAAKVWRQVRAVLLLLKGAEWRQGKAPQNALQRRCVQKMKDMGMIKEGAMEED
eukprot:TRINITY_DN17388_c0_g1_i4.p2 TRINITY_DN17388_c0_g1~~TRINITY_DN17388_c0_g1_i4.p2  ORF type:complete len:250 (-),score=61.83 TRINITY_DN17388_c0_g1_i4:841-1590(-)